MFGKKGIGVDLGVTLLVVSLFALAGLARADVKVTSPDGQTEFQLRARDGRLIFAVTSRGAAIIAPSPLAFAIDGTTITIGATIGKSEPATFNETYSVLGVHSTAVSRGNGARIALSHVPTKTDYTLDVRAFDDAVAFRFIAPGAAGQRRTPDEASAFIPPAGSVAWYHNLRGHYEGQHEKKAVAEIEAGQWAAPPLTLKLPGGAGYAAITEAGLAGYAGMALQADGRGGFTLRLAHNHPASYPFTLRYGEEEAARLAHPAATQGEIRTPWRVVMLGPDLNTLVNCDALTNLSPAPDPALFPQGAATAWVKPGRAVWEYLDGKAPRESTLEAMREYCRLAGQLGFQYNVLEGFWSRWSDEELKGLVEYGKQQGVGLFLWRHSKELRTPEARRTFFKKCHDLGVAGVKLDFFDHEAKETIDLYQTLLKETAENHLLVNFHGSNKPTGESRTWPNEITREAVKGMESSKLADRATHEVTIPFTRLLAGHADYTPVHFGARRANTTWAHQVASGVILTSPLLTYAASPSHILENPCAPMIKSIPAVWDETRVLAPSEIGELAIFARRSGQTWFLAVMNGARGRTLEVPLSFLGEGEYQALMIRDRRDDPAAVRIEEGVMKREGKIAIQMSDGGGFIARFTNK